MSFDRIVRDELSEVAQLRRDLEDLKSTILARTSGHKFDGLWTFFTPTLTATTTNPNPPFREGRYTRIGDLVIYRFRIQFSDSGSVAGSGEYRISTPLPMTSLVPGSDTLSLGSAVLFDWSVAGHKELAVLARANANNLKMYTKNATVFHNNPFTWDNNDRFGGTAIYQTT